MVIGYVLPGGDGVRLAVDIYRPDAPGKVPALLAMSPCLPQEKQATAMGV